MRRFHKYINPREVEEVRYLIQHHDEYDMPMWAESEDGYHELIEVFGDRVVFTEYLSDDLQYVRTCWPDGSMDTKRVRMEERPEP